jgi:hypothetical protein
VTPLTAEELGFAMEVLTDKLGRQVVIDIARPGDPPEPNTQYLVTLEVGGIQGQCEWTWLDVDEAVRVAELLMKVAESANELNAEMCHAR